MRAYFVSDIHLSEQSHKLSAAFLDLLNDCKDKCSHFFILGDLFEIWIGDDVESEFVNKIKSGLLDFTTNGPETFIMHGNRDFLIGEKFSKDTGVKIIPDPFEFNFNNEKVLLSHGDALCIDDTDYINFRNQVRNTKWQNDFLNKSIEERENIAAKLRDDSNDATQNKSMEITDVNATAVKQILDTYSPDVFVHGHTHRPNVHDDETIKRIVLGDWGDQGWYLTLDEYGYNLNKFQI
tara:strand:- start:875 stop:1585 length:711 start_codon:yes stop_codon:yes gene_type:complete